MNRTPTSPIRQATIRAEQKRARTTDSLTSIHSNDPCEYFPSQLLPPNHPTDSELFLPLVKQEEKKTNQQMLSLKTIEYANDIVYFGEETEGVPYNFGIIYDKTNQSIYLEGIWHDGLLNGYGKEYFNDNLHYEGEWKDGNYDGLGTLYFCNGDVHQGEFSKGVIYGNGSLKTVNSKLEKSGFFAGMLCHQEGLPKEIEAKRTDFLANKNALMMNLQKKKEDFLIKKEQYSELISQFIEEQKKHL